SLFQILSHMFSHNSTILFLFLIGTNFLPFLSAEKGNDRNISLVFMFSFKLCQAVGFEVDYHSNSGRESLYCSCSGKWLLPA
ncbi:hypothetical protein L9F63_008494, partial [Diploptera punctata]